MISGRLTLANLDRTLQQARGDLQSVDEKVQHTTLQLTRIRQLEADAYRKLASLRLDQIRDETFMSKLDIADQRAGELLQQRETALAELRQATDESQQKQTGLEQDRQRQNRLQEEAAQQLEHRLEQTHDRLQADAGYQAAQSNAQTLLDQAAAAEEKTQLAVNDKDIKGLPYRNDRLFMYLWKRGYGTERYRAWPLVRFLDRRMARHIRFEQARRNYYMLEEIPQRLQEHTEQLQQKASQAMEALSLLEREAELADGIEPMEQVLTDAKQQLQVTDQVIAEEETIYAGLIDQQEAFAIGKDPYFTKAIEVLVSNFRAEPIPQLRREAESTYGYSDDTEVERLATLRQEKQVLEAGLDEKKSLHQRHASRVHELEDVRRQFKGADYDAPNSRFSDGEMLEVLMTEFLRGQISAARLWKALARNQRFVRNRSYPHPGPISIPGGIKLPSGGRLPRGIRIPGGWGGRRGGGIRLPKIPRGGGGGFRTGGGF